MKRFQFTIKDLLVLMTVVAFVLGGLIIPALQHARESSRRTQCMNNLKQFGIAIHTYVTLHGNQFPPSSQIVDNGEQKTVSGWSFIAHIFPQLEYSPLYPLPLKQVQDPLTSTDPAVLREKETLILTATCPSNPNRLFSETNSGRKEFFTNYKAMGATTAESLQQCLDTDEPPPYGKKEMHPDGAFFPGKGVPISELQIDGLTSTILMVETIDDLHSVWLAGADATLVGMPEAPMEKPPERSFWAPQGYNGKYSEYASPEVKALRTFLGYDFRPGGKDAGTYPASVGRTPRYGPSSGHPGVVNHLFADGSVHSLDTDIDYALYFFAITRKGGDTGHVPMIGE
ncbi:MAG: DUF1559 domain-containing protein [Pirellulales bacterium]|nr:DUF1559 domain-containing protein [Pirellulales bacterium]